MLRCRTVLCAMGSIIGIVAVALCLFTISLSLYQEKLDENNDEPVPWMASARLDPDGRYWLHWRVIDNKNETDASIEFEVQVRTKGWVGFGLSTNGKMAGSDVVIGWVDNNGNVTFHDRFAEAQALPPIDESQDYKLIKGYENDTHTVLRFRRLLDTCDHKDIRITDDTIRVIYSYHFQDPADIHSIKYHQVRGSRSLLLLATPTSQAYQKPDHTIVWDVRLPNVSIPPIHTLYWCQFLQLPNFTEKLHMVANEPIIQTGHETLVHHMILYECPGESLIFPGMLNEGYPCYDNESLEAAYRQCQSPLLAWAVGNEGEILPDEVGVPVGHKYGGTTYFMLEMHYDNPDLTEGMKDSSGVRIYLTNKLRPHDGGIINLGYEPSTFSQIIPPKQKQFVQAGHCPQECTTPGIPKGGINIFAVLLHSHLLGRKIRFRHFRNGTELLPISADENYDFNYQEMRHLNKEIKVLPGDHLIAECVYNSMERVKTTMGGLSTREEMCLVFPRYYPRLGGLSKCVSFIPFPAIFDQLNIVEEKARSLESNVQPGEILRILDTFESYNWASAPPSTVNNLQDMYNNPKVMMAYCESYGHVHVNYSSVSTDLPQLTPIKPQKSEKCRE